MKNISNVDINRERLERWLSETNLTPGSRLPSERELCELLDTRRMTLRQVLLELEVASLIFRKNRSGWFIAPKRFIYNPKAQSSFNAEARAQGRQPFWGYLEEEQCEVPPLNVAKAFSDNSRSYRVTGWCGLDGHKVFYHESYIDADFAPDFIKKINNQSFADVWEKEYGQFLSIKSMLFKPVKIPDQACKELGVAPNSFVILVEKHRATREKRVVQVDFEYWRLESVELYIQDE
ncbi:MULTISPECIES: GntR family transcriptional regulator [Buttiauxella]|jgi:DNA-binding GntR family transcriptional regulator|uniref:GntR family transcriptional regulator n=1 Tax=Buttiauxella ferragutiae ATCC 51602 TaxID=1354252 RepID=A0ABX2W6Z5_9ENTR|nr:MULTISPECIES: GntR family transcriptional regulator [Buttiauxella]AYN26448.1 GntR family transcriptional regulator [Buttiauxella sp. 3AFRM03]MCE0827629.1 GntR family transcriptional regulator [Buttiauxella ferragutiae]OAT26649.1 GntR family transcriptional regulator [Buttiauxella ferragutiae ATCC 51602]UNK63314.1 GntR family transcriptional regulator [Buttiauxella ferragutiae]